MPNVWNTYIGEAGRLISNILYISDKLSIDDYFVAVDIERAFDSLYHGFLLAVLKNLALGIILWIVSK